MTPLTTPIRVFLVDDHAVVRRGMRAFFEMLDDIEVVGEAGDGQAALDELAVRAASNDLPDVVLMDLLMPRLDGIGATKAIKQLYPAVEVVALTSFSEAERVHVALEAGAAGYLLKDAEADQVGAAVRAAMRGQVHLDPAVARTLTRSLVRAAADCHGVDASGARDPGVGGAGEVESGHRRGVGDLGADRANTRVERAEQAGVGVADSGGVVGGA